MAYILHTLIKDYNCVSDVECDDIITDVYLNKVTNNQKSITSTGFTMLSLSGGMSHGRTRPLMGWSVGKNFSKADLILNHMIEISNLADKYSLQADIKLGNQGGEQMQWISFRMVDPSTGLFFSMARVMLPSFPITLPTEIHVLPETVYRLRITGDINPAFLPPAGMAASMDFQLAMHINGSYPSNGFDIIAADYWAGVLDVNLNLFKENTC